MEHAKHCKLHVCCNSCMSCVFSRGSTKQISKRHSGKDQNKACKQCFFLKSLVFCSSCRKCPQCCPKSTCGGHLKDFWQTWASKGASPRVVSILKNSYNLPFKVKPPITRIPLVKSGYTNLLRNSYLQEALHSLFNKQAIEVVKFQFSLAFYNSLSLVSKPNNKWRPVLDLSCLNKFLKV